MQSAEHFDSIGINRREAGENWADSGLGEVHEGGVGTGGLHRISEALSGGSTETDWAPQGPDYTPAERNLIEDFHNGNFGGDGGELPHGLA